MQSEYRDTEDAFLQINPDLFISMDNKQCILMVILDLSAMFDSVKH